jgi:hypothetical protein
MTSDIHDLQDYSFCQKNAQKKQELQDIKTEVAVDSDNAGNIARYKTTIKIPFGVER